ncbi:MAG TPA: ABC-2 family transporter protein [Kribbellaceae bacterium]
MGVYAAIALRSFRRFSTYRVATASGAFTNTVWGFILCGIYLTLWHLRPGLGGYDASAAVTFVWLQQGLMQPLGMFGGGVTGELGERVRTGAIAVDLYRPVNLLAWWLAADIGRAAFQLTIRGCVPLLIGSLTFDLRFPGSPRRWLAFAVAVALGLLISFALRYLVALSGFWLNDSRGAEMALMTATLFFSGMLLPLVAFPDRLGAVARATPWAGMLQVPVDVWLGRQPGGVLGAFAFQGAWAVVLLLAGLTATSYATRKVVVSGG